MMGIFLSLISPFLCIQESGEIEIGEQFPVGVAHYQIKGINRYLTLL
jgi:hypothetical protein